MPRRTEQEKNLHQIPVRVHTDDWKMMRKLFIDENLSFQTFVAACVQAYLHGNPHFLKALKEYEQFMEVPKEVRESYTLSMRERNALLKEIESNPPEDGKENV